MKLQITQPCNSLIKSLKRKCLSSAEWHHSNIKWVALGILYGLERFYHFYFAEEIYIITDHKPLVAMVSKDVAGVSQWLQCIMLCINKDSLPILYKTGPDLYIADWLSWHNHMEIRDKKIAGMSISIHTINAVVDIPVCILIGDITAATK